MVEGMPGSSKAYTNASLNAGMDGLALYHAPVSMSRMHFEGFDPMARKPPITVNTFSHGDQLATKTQLAGLTTDGALLELRLAPGRAAAITDVNSSVTGQPGSLLVPIRPCLAGKGGDPIYADDGGGGKHSQQARGDEHVKGGASDYRCVGGEWCVGAGT